MHIRRLTVSGFKSYGEKTVLEFSEGVNLIVGENGSGKSNLFSAIEFVLNHVDYRRLSEIQRKSLVFEEGRKRLADGIAYVEVELDNEDRRFPFDTNTVTLRRTVGAAKDKFIVNGKEETTSAISGYLEAAGFINPYYIVKQGFVNALAERGCIELQLKLVKEATGVRTYEEKIRKIHSEQDFVQSLLEETENLLTHNLAQAIEDKKAKADEIGVYLELDKDKRALEYLLLKQDVVDYTARKDKINEDRREDLQRAQTLKERIKDLKYQQESKKIECKSGENLVKLLEVRRSEFNEGKEVTTREMNELQVKIELHEGELKKLNEKMEEARGEVEVIEEEESNLKNRTATVEGEYEELEEADRINGEALASVENKLLLIWSAKKKGVGSSREFERWRQDEESNARILIKMKEKSAKNIKICLAKKRGELESKKSAADTLRDKIQERISLLTAANEALLTSNTQVRKLQSELESKMEELLGHSQTMMGKSEEYTMWDTKLKKLVGEPLIKGWRGILSILEDFKRDIEVGQEDGPLSLVHKQQIIDGYHGLVIENFSCPPEARIAVESEGGRKLFYHMVDNKRIGMALMKEFNRRRCAGEVFFISPDNLHRNGDYPPPRGVPRGSVLLKDKIAFDEKFERIFDFFFGRTILVPDIVRLRERQSGFNYISVDGDKHGRNGVMTGGYNQNRMSKIEAMGNCLELNQGLDEYRERKEELEREIEVLKGELEDMYEKTKEAREEKQKNKTKLDRLNAWVEEHKSAIGILEIEIRGEEKLLEKVELEKRTEMDSEGIRDVADQILTVSEAGSSRGGSLDYVKNCEGMIRNLNEEKERIGKHRAESRKRLEKKGKELKRLQNELKKLETRKQALNALILSDRPSKLSFKLEELKLKLAESNEKFERLKKEIRGLDKEMKSAKSQLVKLRAELTKIQDDEKAVEERLAIQMQALHKFEGGLQSVMAKLNEFENKLENLTIPSKVDKYANHDRKRLLRGLRRVIGDMSAHSLYFSEEEESNVSALTKILEEYNEILEKFKEMEIKGITLGTNKETVFEIISEVEDRKTEEFLRGIRKLQIAFREIFSEITKGGGTANLVIVGRTENTEESIESNASSQGTQSMIIRETSDIKDPDLLRNWNVKNLKSVLIEASFTNNEDGAIMSSLQHLSGGQKSVVSLALILAMQRTDPVPFYLFDEVDQALDEAHRSTLTGIIQSLAYPRNTSIRHQFICTTFRPEMAEGCVGLEDKFFKVSRSALESKVSVVSREEALNFLQTTSFDSTVTSSTSEEGASNSGAVPDSTFGGFMLRTPSPSPPPSSSSSGEDQERMEMDVDDSDLDGDDEKSISGVSDHISN